MGKAKEKTLESVGRDTLRAATIGGKIELKSEIIEHEGLQFELRQPSLRERKMLREKAIDDRNLVDPFEAMVWLTIWQTYVPGTNQRVFDEADYEMFLNNPSGTWVDDFGSKIVLMSNLNLGDLRKNS